MTARSDADSPFKQTASPLASPPASQPSISPASQLADSPPTPKPKRDLKTRRKWQAIRADQIRSELIIQLGGQCECCGSTDPATLEFNHIYERTWRSRWLNRYDRMLRYRREAAEGLITLLCDPCNRDRANWPLPREEMPRRQPSDNHPF